ncbi:MAG TPA: hypothetical protein VJ032_01000 [Thermoanaerobaculia bacterium]|nr:hypothetical protein [Thermoanaerobaculia bacterium]
MESRAVTPEFPIRLIFDDGECVDIESPEELLEKVDTLDSADGGVWVRDALDRTVTLKMRGGTVERLDVT